MFWCTRHYHYHYHYHYTTEVLSSPLLFGLLSVLTLTSLTSPPPPTILSPTASWNIFTTASRLLYKPAAPPPTGFAISLGSSSASAPLQQRAPTFLLLNNSTGLLSACLLNSAHATQPLPDVAAPHPLSNLPLSQPIQHNLPLFTSPPSTLPPELLQASHDLISRDAATPPLTLVYTGPFPNISCSPHFFTLQMGQHTDMVSVLRLKAAVMDSSTSSASPPPQGCPPSALCSSSSSP